MRQTALALAMVALAPAAQAHPHVFVDTTIEILVDDQNRATALRIGWSYDDLTSLQIIADRGMDPDFDGVLTPEEQAQINGFDMDWPEGIPGDTYALIGETALDLSRPVEWTTDYRDARLISTHLRRLAQPVALGPDQPLVVQAYDSGYYTAYTITHASVTGGTGCTTSLWEPDPEAASDELKAALAELTPDQDAELQFPAVGAAFADEVRLTCAAP